MQHFSRFSHLILFLLVGWSLLAAPLAQAQTTTAAPAAVAIAPATTVEEQLAQIPEAEAKWMKCYQDCRTNKKECNPNMCAQQCKGQVINMGYNMSRMSDIMNYNVNAAYAASCIEKMSNYFKMIRDAAKAAQLAGLSIDTFIVQTIVDTILDAVLTQIFNAITNAICNITNEALGAIDSFVKNAICLPQLSLGSPLDFHLDLGRMKCDGWSVNALTGQISGSPIEGVSIPSTILNSGANNYSVPDPVLVPDWMINPPAITPNLPQIDVTVPDVSKSQ